MKISRTYLGIVGCFFCAFCLMMGETYAAPAKDGKGGGAGGGGGGGNKHVCAPSRQCTGAHSWSNLPQSSEGMECYTAKDEYCTNQAESGCICNAKGRIYTEAKATCPSGGSPQNGCGANQERTGTPQCPGASAGPALPSDCCKDKKTPPGGDPKTDPTDPTDPPGGNPSDEEQADEKCKKHGGVASMGEPECVSPWQDHDNPSWKCIVDEPAAPARRKIVCNDGAISGIDVTKPCSKNGGTPTCDEGSIFPSSCPPPKDYVYVGAGHCTEGNSRDSLFCCKYQKDPKRE